MLPPKSWPPRGEIKAQSTMKQGSEPAHGPCKGKVRRKHLPTWHQNVQVHTLLQVGSQPEAKSAQETHPLTKLFQSVINQTSWIVCQNSFKGGNIWRKRFSRCHLLAQRQVEPTKSTITNLTANNNNNYRPLHVYNVCIRL